VAVDAALLDLFRAELDTHIPALSAGLLSLEKEAGQPKLLEALMRAAHSIKGAARIVGLDVPVRIAHVMEDCFVAAQKGEIVLSREAVDVLLQSVDTLQQVSLALDDSTSVDETAVQTLVDRVAAIRAGVAVPAKPVAPKEPVIPIVRPAGVLDAAQAETLRQQLVDLLAAQPSRIRLDLSAVESVDPAGLLLLQRAAKHVELIGISPTMAHLLRLLRLDRAFSPAGA